MAAPARAPAPEAEVEITETVDEAPKGHRCRTCAYFASFGGDAVKVQAVGGTARGDCRLEPIITKKQEIETCSRHSELERERAAAAAKVMGDAIGAALAKALK